MEGPEPAMLLWCSWRKNVHQVSTFRDRESQNVLAKHLTFRLVVTANMVDPASKARSHEESHFSTLVSIRDAGSGKGLGVFAKKDIEPWMTVAVYPGYVYSKKEHDRLTKAKKTSNVYGVGVQGKSGAKYVIDPEEPDGSRQTHKMFEASIGHRVNEPSGNKKPNVSYMENFTVQDTDHPRLEYWTNRPVKKGSELVAYYGGEYTHRRGDYTLSEANKKNAGGYVLKFETSADGNRRRVFEPDDDWIGEETDEESTVARKPVSTRKRKR